MSMSSTSSDSHSFLWSHSSKPIVSFFVNEDCRLSINDEEIRDDLQKFRNLASVESSQTQMEEEEDEDRKSRKKIRK